MREKKNISAQREVARFAHAAFGWKIEKFFKFGGRKWDSGAVLSELVAQISAELLFLIFFIFPPPTFIQFYILDKPDT